MKAENINKLYTLTPSLRQSVDKALQQLDDSVPKRYHKQSSIRRVAIVFAIIALLVAFSTVAYATHMFGLLTEKVGKYGLDMHIVRESTSDNAEKPKSVKLKLGYIPDGYEQIKDENGNIEPNKYSYGGKPISDRWGFSFIVYTDAAKYSKTEEYIVDSSEETINGHNIIFMTQQFEYNGEKQYLAAEYFKEWDTVVVGYCVNKTELAKIMRNLDLEEDTEYVEPETIDWSDEPYSGYSFSMTDEKREYKLGETFIWTQQIVDAPDFTSKDGEYEVTVKSVDKHDGVKGLGKNNLLAPNDKEWYDRYFTGNGDLKTPYIRTERENGDGIDSLDNVEEVKMNRYFYLVTVEVKPIEERYGGFNGQFMTNSTYGGVIYQEKHHENGSDILTIGIVADEDELNDLALDISSQETVIDSKTETVVRKNIDTIIPLLVKQ